MKERMIDKNITTVQLIIINDLGNDYQRLLRQNTLFPILHFSLYPCPLPCDSVVPPSHSCSTWSCDLLWPKEGTHT